MMSRHYETRKSTISLQYFFYFGVLGVYLPYFNLYCYSLGFSGTQIGVLSAFRAIVLVVFSIIWSTLADRYQIQKPIYVLCIWASTAIWAAYLFSDRYWVVFVITGCYGLFYAPIISFLEAFTIDILGEQKRRYGSIRVWGSVSFVAMVIIVGYCIDLLSIKMILWVILAGSTTQSVFSLGLPTITLRKKEDFYLKAKMLLSRDVVVFLGCAFLMLVSHGMYYGFFSIHLSTLGYGSLFIGFAWSLASIAEILVMINSKRIFRLLSYQKALTLSFGVAAIRWLLIGIVHSPYGILALQCLHALTYALFHVASILYMDSLSPGEAKTLGQAINNAITYGLGLMVGFFLSGVLYEHFNAVTGFLVCGGIAFFSCIAFIGYSARRPVKERSL